MPAGTAVRYDRLQTEQLMVALPMGEEPHHADLIRLPQTPRGMQYVTPLRRSNYGPAWYEHVYGDDADRSALHNLHVILNQSRTGNLKEPPVAQRLGSVAGDLSRQFPDLDLQTRVAEVRDDYMDAEEKNRQEFARGLSRAIGEKVIYVCARFSGRDENVLYAARVQELLNLREDDRMAYEPVVSTPAGTRLLPVDMYIPLGIYAPTVD